METELTQTLKMLLWLNKIPCLLIFWSLFSLIDEIENAVRFIRCSRLELEASFTPATADIPPETNYCCEYEKEANMSFTCEQSDATLENFISCNNTGTCCSDDIALHELSVCTSFKNDIISRIDKMTYCQKNVMKFLMSHYQSKKSDGSFSQICMFTEMPTTPF